MSRSRLLLVAAFALSSVTPMFGAGPSFHPDKTFAGSSLAGWHTLGQADWRAENGELTGTPKAASGGWLMLDHSYQDVGVFTQFRCQSGCETGVLLRAEKTPSGMKGVYVSLSDPQVASYSVTLDQQGNILERTRLPRGGGLVRIAPPPDPNAPAREFHFPTPPPDLPFSPPDTKLRANDWNDVEILFDANIVRTFLNNGREFGGIGDEGYGPIALYVGGTGQVSFKGLSYKDLGLKVRLPDRTSPDFRKQQLSDFYYSWSSAAADFNHDGVLDVVSGPYIYYGPDYTKRREMYLAESVNPSTKFADDSWMDFAADFNGDGWPDVITV
ncbi:MAG TPA: family 16 glycoside hydrolase, partial [Acidobacteriaceae bacterium]|nr:family 16 glycoside hydrolase [Acidobacteriaceae bacterium]